MSVFPQSPVLDATQFSQEEEYQTPYHWGWTPSSEPGREYFCYLDRVVGLIPQMARDLLDVGCGDGRGTSFMKDRRPDIRVYGSDYSERALQLSRIMSAPQEMEWLAMDLYKGNGMDGRQFDVVTATEVLEHIPPEKLQDALRNLHASIRDGGCLILTVPTILADQPPKHYQHFTLEVLRSLLEAAGFRIDHAEGQERAHHPFFTLYKFVDNRWWCFKPLMRWLNIRMYPRCMVKTPISFSHRLIIRASVEKDGSSGTQDEQGMYVA